MPYPPIYGCQQKRENSFGFEENRGKVSGRIELVAGIELHNLIVQLIKISPSFNLEDGFDLDDGFETASCRQKEHSFEIFRSFLEFD